MILLIILVLLTVLTVAAISVGGTAFIVLFGDVIVCGFIIIWILKKIVNRKK